MVKRFNAGTLRLVVAALLALVVGFASAATVPADALDASSIATDAITDLTTMVGDALPYIAASIGLGIVLGWVRRLFRA